MWRRAIGSATRLSIALSIGAIIAIVVASCGGGSGSESSSTTVLPDPEISAAPTSVAPTTSLVEITDPTWFSTPSGNISCAVRADWVRCDIVERDWSPPPRPADCVFDWGPSVAVESSGEGRFLCVSDTVYRPEVVVAYGSRVRVSAMSCAVLAVGVVCDSATGHGFSLAREAHELW